MTVTVPMDSSHYSCVGVLVVYHASKQQPSSLYWLPDTFWNMFFFSWESNRVQDREKRESKRARCWRGGGKTTVWLNTAAALLLSGLCRWSHATSTYTGTYTFTVSQANSRPFEMYNMCRPISQFPPFRQCCLFFWHTVHSIVFW